MNASAVIAYLRGQHPWRRVWFSLAMGIIGAAASVVLVLACNWANGLWQGQPLWLFALPALGAASVWLFQRLGLKAHVTPGDVIRDIRDDQRVDSHLAPAALLGTCASLAGGASVGKTATAMEVGAALGSGLVGRFRVTEPAPGSNEERPCYGYGAAVGLTALVAALFTAPLAAVAFVLELLRLNSTRPQHVPTLLLTAFVAAGLARVAGVSIVVPMTPILTLTWETAAHAALIGAACAIGGALYSWAVSSARSLVRTKLHRPYLGVCVGGILVCAAVLGLDWTLYAGTGEELLSSAFAGTAPAEAWVFKGVLTVVSLGFGLVGGEITPLLIVGALLGSSLATLTNAYVPLMAGLGMLAFLAAGARCPWSAIFLGCELFGWDGFWFYAIAVVIAFAGSRDVGLYGQNVAGHTRLLRERVYTMLYRAGLGRPITLLCQLLGRPAPAVFKTLGTGRGQSPLIRGSGALAEVVPAERIGQALEQNPKLAQSLSQAIEKNPQAQADFATLVKEDPALRGALEKSLDLHPDIAAHLYATLGENPELKGLAEKTEAASLRDHVRPE